MKIGVLTEEPKNEDVAGALKEAGEALGAEIVILDINECAIVNSASPEVLYQGKPLDSLDAILVRGSESKLEFRTHIVDYLTDKGVIMVNPSDAIKACDNKFLTQSMLNKAGIKTPDTVAIVQIEQLDSAVNFLHDQFPMIVKTVSGSHGVGVIKVESFEGLKSLVQYLLAQKTDIMVQEFIPHKESGRIMILGDQVIAAVMRSIPDGDFRSNMDQGAELSKHEATDIEIETALKVASTLGCMLSAIDYIINPDGEMVVFEANSSPGLKGIQSVNEEINIAELIMKFIINLVEGKAAPSIDQAPGDVVNTPPASQEPTRDKTEEEEEETVPEMPKAPVAAPMNNPDAETVSLEETIIIKRINGEKPFSAKVDTGADKCSLHGENIEVGDDFVKFDLEGTKYKVTLDRHVKVIATNGEERRPIVKFNVEFNGNNYEGIEFNISDRSSMSYPVIIGKNLLVAAGVLVDPQE